MRQIPTDHTATQAEKPPSDFPHGDRWFRLLIDSVQDYAIFMLDLEGRIVTWNAGAEKLKGYRRDEVIGRHFSIFYPRDAVEKGWPDWELEIAKANGRFEDEGWRVRRDGSTFWANIIITVIRDERGIARGFSKITRDLTGRHRDEQELQMREEHFRVLVEGLRDNALFTIDREGLVTSWNVGAERVTGYRADEVLGFSFDRFYSPGDIALDRPQHQLEMARESGHSEDQDWRIRRDGVSYLARLSLTAIPDDLGRVRGFTVVLSDLTQHKRAEDLEESQRRMMEFLAMLGHELRNPLAPIRNAVSIMSERDVSKTTVEWSTRVIARQVEHLTRLVEDLLDVSRLTRGKINVRHEPVELVSAVTSAIEAARPLIDARGHQFEVDLTDEKLVVAGDVTRLAQIVLNLLNNAAKYTPEGGTIRISMKREGEDAVLRVVDTGIGISPDLAARVFDLFVQGERSLDRTEGGLGIGLTLVQRLVAMHEGQVEVSSRGPGLGSEFIVHLPLQREKARARAVEEPGRESRAVGDGRRVLLVDDNLDAAETLTALLRAWGYDVSSVHDAWTALMVAADQRPDVALLDIGLPGMTGYELAERMRALPGLASIILVAITGYGQDEDRGRARQAGFQHHLVKPVDLDALRALLDALPLRSAT
ncbi:MAG TPA: PAS domain S-box protein [Candidatus Udaeobacter sp.]|nr:PAS domain S-box protein [Candidatus Udaeobacter sp.]